MYPDMHIHHQLMDMTMSVVFLLSWLVGWLVGECWQEKGKERRSKGTSTLSYLLLLSLLTF